MREAATAEQTALLDGDHSGGGERRTAARREPQGALQIEVPGKPAPMPRVKARVVEKKTGESFAHVYTPSGPQARKADFTAAWLEAGHHAFDREVPVAFSAEFVFARPASHFGTGRNAGILKPRFRLSRPGGGVGGGDLDNLLKLVTDALEGVAFHNDSQIARFEDCEKRYANPGEHPKTIVRVRPLIE